MKYNIKNYLQAGYPLIWKEEHDETKFIAELKTIADNGKTKTSGPMDLYTWDVVNGLKHHHKDKNKKPEIAAEKMFDKFFDALLNKMMDEGKKSNKRPSIIALLNIEHILNQNLRAQQMLKEFIILGKEHQQHIILVSTTLNYPKSIEKDLAIIPYEYPEEYMLKKVLNDLNSATTNTKLDSNLEEKFVQAAKGLTLTEAENAYSLAMVENRGLNQEAVQTVQRIKTQMLGGAGILTYIPPTLKMSDVGGLDNLKEWLEIRKSALFSEEARVFGLNQPKGVLIAGVPGAGKSLTAKAIASSWELPLLHFDISQVFGGLVGQSEKQMKDTLTQVESISPCILWLDEIEKAFSSVGSSSDSGATTRVFGQFLTWMQEKKSTVFVVATANDVQHLPSAFIRKGRFDEFFFVDLPNEEERKVILELHLNKRNRKELNPKNFNISLLVEKTYGFTGSELEECINSALYNAFYKKRELKDNDLIQAAEDITPISVTMKEDIAHLRNWAKDRARNASKSESEINLDDIKAKSEKLNRPIMF